jgi:hypothetical protein
LYFFARLRFTFYDALGRVAGFWAAGAVKSGMDFLTVWATPQAAGIPTIAHETISATTCIPGARDAGLELEGRLLIGLVMLASR